MVDEPKQLQIDMNAQTTPVLYTDNILITVNEDGVVLDIGQRVGNTEKMYVVSRIGMSREHGKKFVAQLGKVLALTSKEEGKKRN